MRFLSTLLVATVAAASFVPSHSRLSKRDEGDTCSDLTITNNNGDRKVAIVVDSSLSMQDNDPSFYRIAAARALNRFLVANGEGSKPDQVAVVEFYDEANLVYPIGDPNGADRPISNISNDNSGTFIASGVQMGFAEIQKGSGGTDARSAIVVFTDGEDSSTSTLVAAIQAAADAGVRVSFGFISNSVRSQSISVLRAIRNSRGIYATIADPAGAQNFINYALLNGLTYNDNPQGYDSSLLAGLGQTYAVTGNGTVTLKYRAAAGERVNFTIESISSGRFTALVTQGGQQLGNSSRPLTRAFIDVNATGSSDIDVAVTADNAPTDGLFSILTNSNVPIKNCTVGVSGNAGLSPGAKAGIGVGVTIGVLGLLGTAGYFGYQHFFGPKTVAPMATGTEAMGHADPTNMGAEKFGLQENVTQMAPNSNFAPPSAPPEPLYAPGPTSVPPANSVPFFVPPVVPPNAMKPMHPKGYNPNDPNAGHDPNQTNPNVQPTDPNMYNNQPGLNYYDPNTMPHNHPGLNYPDPNTYNNVTPNQPGLDPGTQPTGNQPGPSDPYHQPYQPPAQPTDPTQPPQSQPPQQFDMPDMPEDPRFPKVRRSAIEKHHHHEWIPFPQPCEDQNCPLNANHDCHPNEDQCACNCFVQDCPVTKEREDARMRRDLIATAAANIR